MNNILKYFLSLRLTVTLLSLSMILVFCGTLAQVDKGIWTVMDQYFRTWIAWIDLSIFFNKFNPLNAFSIPFPGGFLIGALLSMNLLVVHAKTFKIFVTGKRLYVGLSLLIVGLILTYGVIVGWGTNTVATTESDAFWRVFFRLGRGTLSAVILFIACIYLYRKRAGMVLLHAGILLLLIGEFFTALFAVESTMTIREGQTVNFLDRSQKYELAFIEYSNPNFDRVTVIPKDFLKINKINEFDELPFNIKLNSFMANSSQPQSINNITNFDQLKYHSYKGIGSEYYISNTREVSGASGERNAPAVDVELFDKKSGNSLGRYILSLWCYPNFVNQIWDMPNLISYNGKNYRVYLRNQREFSLSPSGNEFSIKLLNFVHEKYQGTQTPKDFSSRIRLINSGDKIDRELKIWMNNPLRYAKKTFYQSGYLPEDKGTVLQVVRNDSWMIPYLSCMIVFVGMGAQFFWSMQRSKKKGNL